VAIRVLTIGDVVGKPGRKILSKKVRTLREELSCDVVIANGENVAGGSGITPVLLDELCSYGIDVVTTGDHIFKKKEIIARLETDARIIRPLNYPTQAAGKGLTYITTPRCAVAIINLIGRVFMQPNRCPFLSADEAIAQISDKTPVIIVDFHAEATSEKVAMGWYLDGRVSAVLGTHTHVATCDARILPHGTAYITDLGMTGPYESVIGRQIDKILSRLITGMPTPFDVADHDVRICGALVEIDETTGRALSIQRVEVRDETAEEPGE
jgi:hypothetical protein